ncbi:MAG: methyltransferase domain-containing protein [Clostridia bacterium]|nr:methyltransferase domain-containing protein [Clostridia bacterium]
MQIIYDSYEKDNIYDGQSVLLEEKVAEYIKQEKNLSDILNEDYDSSIQNIFSKRAENVINALDIDSETHCLELLGRFGTFTRILSDKYKSITTVETIKQRAEINYSRNIDKTNIEIICTSDVLSLKYSRKFDTIFMINVLENVNALLNDYTSSSDNLCVKLLERYKKLLNPGGKIIIVTNNKLSIKYLSGAKEYEKQNSYSPISSNQYMYGRYFSKNELNGIIEKSGFEKSKYYYVLPDIYCPSVVYSDEYLPSKDASKLNYNIYYNSFDTVVFSEIEAIKEITKARIF